MNRVSARNNSACVALVICAASAMAHAQTVTALHDFCEQSSCPDGSAPTANLIQATDGNLYGTTSEGGTNSYAGTLFMISPSGVFTTLYRFCTAPNCADGSRPAAGLFEGQDGNFYGTTKSDGPFGGGTVFQISPSGTLTTLYGFCSASATCTDGKNPEAGVIQAPNGNFYGTTSFGGASGRGTVFEITPSGTLTVLHSFCLRTGCADGASPTAGLVQTNEGDFYGTTEVGGLAGCPGGCGTAFKINSAGTFSTIYNFCSALNCADGSNPFASLIQGTDGDLYGTASSGGIYSAQCAYSLGTIFKLTKSGSLTTLYSFISQGSACAGSGGVPVAGLAPGSDGEFYGTALDGGTFCGTGCGTIFKITRTGVFTPLYSFCVTCIQGQSPNAALLQDTNGEFYGTTAAGGTGGRGAVFSLSVGLGRFVRPRANQGKVGAPIEILGTGLTGATSVSFNGTPAAFRVISSSVIATNVPSGAGSGPIVVETLGGPLSSRMPFYVLP